MTLSGGPDSHVDSEGVREEEQIEFITLEEAVGTGLFEFMCKSVDALDQEFDLDERDGLQRHHVRIGDLLATDHEDLCKQYGPHDTVMKIRERLARAFERITGRLLANGLVEDGNKFRVGLRYAMGLNLAYRYVKVGDFDAFTIIDRVEEEMRARGQSHMIKDLETGEEYPIPTIQGVTELIYYLARIEFMEPDRDDIDPMKEIEWMMKLAQLLGEPGWFGALVRRYHELHRYYSEEPC